MAIPDYQSIMLPLLEQLSNREEYRFRDLIEQLATSFGLSEEERKELLPSGSQAIFDNRVGWAKTYLKKAKLLGTPIRGVVKISDRGLDVLKEQPAKINVKFLRQFPEFVEFQKPSKEQVDDIDDLTEDGLDTTPEETLENAYQKIRETLAQEVIGKVYEMSPTFFERLVVELLVKMGYGGSIQDAGKATRKSNDEGIDGIIKEDRLGLDIVYIQAKRWKQGNVVGRPEIQNFVGALAGKGAKKGIFITTSSFANTAYEYVRNVTEQKIALVDGHLLAQLMIEHDLGVATHKTYAVKRLDSDYYGEE